MVVVMSIQTTLDYLQTLLGTMNPAPNIVKNAPTESVSAAEFPMIMVMLAPQITNSWRIEASGYGRHTYFVTIYVFAGFRNTGITELHNRILGYPKAIADVLLADMTLGGNVTFIGDGGGGVFSYRYGEIGWGEARLWGLVVNLVVTEKHVQTTN
jgi:hypothetical protein